MFNLNQLLRGVTFLFPPAPQDHFSFRVSISAPPTSPRLQLLILRPRSALCQNLRFWRGSSSVARKMSNFLFLPLFSQVRSTICRLLSVITAQHEHPPAFLWPRPRLLWSPKPQGKSSEKNCVLLVLVTTFRDQGLCWASEMDLLNICFPVHFEKK